MRSFYTFIVGHRKSIIALFLIIFIVCIFLRGLVKVNYDMTDYLPEDSQSTVSLDLMEREFDGGIPNARVMVKDVTVTQALKYKERIAAVKGVTEVTWLDDSNDLTVPIGAMDREAVEKYYKDNAALFSVTIEEDSRISAIAEIREIIGKQNAVEGDAASIATATESTVSEIKRIAIFAVLFVLIILVITTRSWLEPLIILGGLGIAIVINMGSNIIFGEISFVTNAAGSILQLAVSLDYSVFLIHRFEECRRAGTVCGEYSQAVTSVDSNRSSGGFSGREHLRSTRCRHLRGNSGGTADIACAKTAMIDALCKSTGSILSSGATTVIGFMALILMQYQIGPDLGLALAKGVCISLITVFVFMPAFIISTYRLMDKTRHKSFLPDFSGFGKVICRIMIPMVCIFAVTVIPAFLASNANDYYYGASHIFGPGTELGDDTTEIKAIFGQSDTYALLIPKTDPSVQRELADELTKLPQVTDLISYAGTVGSEIPEEYIEPDILCKLNSDHHTRMVISAAVPQEGQSTFELVKEIRSIADKYYPGEYYLAGSGVSTYDLMDTVTEDMLKINLVAIIAVYLVLVLMMRSLFLPVILVLGIETAIWINLSIPYFADSPVFYIAYLIISSVQLGATVDYAILFTDRYREFRRTMDKKEAVIRTVSSVTPSILTSGSALVMIGFLLGLISTHGLLAQLGIFVGRGGICSLLIVFLVLPGLLYIFDRLYIGRTLHSKRNKKSRQEEDIR